MADIAREVGVNALHANELGVAKIEAIADDLLKIVKRADARFFISRVEKKYLATTKVFDTYFDAGENLAVPWQVYWIRTLKLTMMFKLSQYVITSEIVEIVWDCLTASSEHRSKELFLAGAEAMLVNVPNLPDARSRTIVGDAMRWALENPENFHTHSPGKGGNKTHSPNFVAFTGLLEGMDRASKLLKSPLREIVHDEQSEFEKTLRQWHGVVSNPKLAKVEPIRWPGEKETLTLSRAPGSGFRTATEETSPGLQVVDIVLWLFKRVLTNKDIGLGGARLLERVSQRGSQNDFSFTGVGAAVERHWAEVYREEMTDEKRAVSAELIAKAEANRVRAMADYAAEKTRSAYLTSGS